VDSEATLIDEDDGLPRKHEDVIIERAVDYADLGANRFYVAKDLHR